MSRPSIGEDRTSYPLTCYLVSGTQAEPGRQNFIVLMKMHNLVGTRQVEGMQVGQCFHWDWTLCVIDGDDDDDDEEEEEEVDALPQLESVLIKHDGAINRIRVPYIHNCVQNYGVLGLVYRWLKVCRDIWWQRGLSEGW